MILEDSEMQDVLSLLSTLVRLMMYILISPFLEFFLGDIHEARSCLELKTSTDTFPGGSTGAASEFYTFTLITSTGVTIPSSGISTITSLLKGPVSTVAAARLME